jgi:hypothetical protein
MSIKKSRVPLGIYFAADVTPVNPSAFLDIEAIFLIVISVGNDKDPERNSLGDVRKQEKEMDKDVTAADG